VPRKVRLERIEYLLRLFELWERRMDLVKVFSGGMKRRLEIARGLLHTPKILFLDEPTLGLDPQTRNQLWTHVKHLNAEEGVTVFLTTHYMDEAERTAHRVAIIDHGQIVAQGTVQELRELKRYSRARAQIIGSLAQPALYLLVLGFGFGSVFQQAGQGSYLQFMAP